jgi:hypothetical protein
MYGKGRFARAISPGLTVTEEKSGTLRDWVERVFGAAEIEKATTEVGHVIRGVWRPGLYSDEEILQALDVTEADARLAEQSLLLLVERLEEIFLYIEPDQNTLSTYSHKTRELLILSCTEVENYWKRYLAIANVPPPSNGSFTTNHYVKLQGSLHLREYQIELPRYAGIRPIRPFENWAATNPTKSLGWYDAYNKTKHDRDAYFDHATLQNCIEAVAANLAMFSVRFGPYRMFHGRGPLAAIINSIFTIELWEYNPTTSYPPSIVIPVNQRRDLVCYNAWEQVEPRIIDELVI